MKTILCVKVLVSSVTSQTVNVANVFGLVSFFSVFWGFLCVNISEVKNPRKCHDLKRKCRILIREWVGLFGLRVNDKGRHFVGFRGYNFQKYGN